MSQVNSTSPLKGASTSSNDPSSSSRITTGAINVLAVGRAAVGVGLMIAPRAIVGFFGIPLTASTAIYGRMIGGRELVLGDLTYMVNKEKKDRSELRHVLWANVAFDALDIGALAYGFATSAVSRTAVGLFGGGALSFIALGAIGLRSL